MDSIDERIYNIEDPTSIVVYYLGSTPNREKATLAFSKIKEYYKVMGYQSPWEFLEESHIPECKESDPLLEAYRSDDQFLRPSIMFFRKRMTELQHRGLIYEEDILSIDWGTVEEFLEDSLEKYQQREFSEYGDVTL